MTGTHGTLTTAAARFFRIPLTVDTIVSLPRPPELALVTGDPHHLFNLRVYPDKEKSLAAKW